MESELRKTRVTERKSRIQMTIVENLDTGTVELVNPKVECVEGGSTVSAKLIGRIIVKMVEAQNEYNNEGSQ